MAGENEELSDGDSLLLILAEEILDKKEQKRFVPGGDNLEFFEENQDPGQVLGSISSAIVGALFKVGKVRGIPPDLMEQFFRQNWEFGGQQFTDQLLSNVSDPRFIGRGAALGAATKGVEVSPMKDFYLNTISGFDLLVSRVWDWYNQRAGFDLGTYKKAAALTTGGGRGGPTAQQIRNQFDIDQLAEVADDIWRKMLLDDTPNPRAMARAYVDAVVAGGGEVSIDFREFIRKQAMATDRFASVYVNKPPSLSPEQYIGPYFASAQQVVRPGEAAAVAIGGAQFGSDAQTFGARLRRSDEATSASSFINELQGRLSGLSGLFKG